MRKRLPAFLSCQGLRLSEAEKHLFSKYKPIGVCLFAKGCGNIQNKEQIKALVEDIKSCIEDSNVLIAIDQEGGRVRRLLEPEFTAVTAQQNINTIEMAKQHAYLISSDLQSCGINVNFAPVLDIMTPKTSNVLQGRCFDQNIAELAKTMVDEYIKNGICPCIKHMPGHGKAAVDPHLYLPVIEETIEELQADFAPFEKLKDAPMGMAAHIVLNAVDKQNAVTVSPKVISHIIRDKIGFTGLLVSDAIVMRALKGSIAEKSNSAIHAGCDVICLGNADFDANLQLCESGIEMTDEAKQRLNNVFEIIKNEGDFSQYEQVKNKYCANLKNIIDYDYNYDATEVLNRLHTNNN